jgi:AbiU2
MCSDQQIEKIKGHVLIFAEELEALIQSFELLLPPAEDREFLQNISGTKRARGFSVNRWNLIQVCIIGITKLAYDASPQNPTAANIIKKILDPQAGEIRQNLKDIFTVPLKSSPVPGRPQIEEDLVTLEEIDKIELEDLGKAFDQSLSDLDREWQWFGEHREKFKNLRDQRLAHIDVAKVGQTYQLKKAPGPEWAVIKEAMQRLIKIAELLLTIVHNRSVDFDQSAALARRDARDFWEI